jgi:hypothetical protein
VFTNEQNLPLMAIESLQDAGRCWLVVADFVGRVKVFDAKSYNLLWDIRAHARMVTSIAVNVQY